MIYKYILRGAEVVIDTGEFARNNAHVNRLKLHLDRIAGAGRAALADQALAGLIARIVRFYGESYLPALNDAMERISRARNEIATELDLALERKLPDFEKIKRNFDEIDLAFPELLSPEQAADKAPVLTVDAFIGPRRAPLTLADVFARVRRAVSRLTAGQNAALERAEAADAGALRKAITAEERESVSALKRRLKEEHGWSESDAAELMSAVEKLNEDWRAQNDPKVAAQAREALEPEIDKLPAQLRKAVRGSKVLQDLLRANPEQLNSLWGKYIGKTPKRLYGFALYVWFNMLHVKGHLGEYSAAFDLGNVLIFLKGPKEDVTTPGTDLVAIDPATGEVLLIDNKAVKAKLLSKVTALMRNIAKNLADDVAEFQRGAAGKEMAPAVEAVLRRLERASRKISDLAAGKSKEALESAEMQAEIAEILKEHGVRRVVTNAGGKLDALSSKLDAAGIELENLNEPESP
jgi:hypothetical protein